MPVMLPIRPARRTWLLICAVALTRWAPGAEPLQPSTIPAIQLPEPSQVVAPPDAKPDSAEPVALTLLHNNQPATVLFAQPGQVLDVSLQLSSEGQTSPGMAPIANAAGGLGAGQAVVTREETVAWAWSAGIGLKTSGRELTWRAPDAGGHYQLEATFLARASLAQTVTGPLEHCWGRASFDVLVYDEYDPKKLTLQDVPIGLYPDPNKDTAPASVRDRPQSYDPPRWFLRVTNETRHLPVSAHFSLGDFAPVNNLASDSGRSFIALDRGLIDRLEAIRAECKRLGLGDGRLKILRAYLSPLAAESLRRDGAQVSEYSRFLYGDAAIIILDGDNDGMMDDLTRDGKIDAKDALALADVCEEVERTGHAGGLGIYGASPDRTLPNTPFVHVDLRGTRARWDYKLDAGPVQSLREAESSVDTQTSTSLNSDQTP